MTKKGRMNQFTNVDTNTNSEVISAGASIRCLSRESRSIGLAALRSTATNAPNPHTDTIARTGM